MAQSARRKFKGRQWGDVPGGRLLPPDAAWNSTLKPGERLPTPTDSRGFVKIPETIGLVKGLIEPGYTWAPNLSVHHFYWKSHTYHTASSVAKQFCELPIHKGLVFREFENVLHVATEPVPVPEEEAMYYRVEAWDVAHDLFANASQLVAWGRRSRRREELLRHKPEILPPEFHGEDIIGREVLAEELERNFSGLEQHLARASRIPPEFRLFDPEADARTLATQLGGIVVPQEVCLLRATAA